MQTIARLTKYSIKYYNDTANEAQQAVMDRQSANRGLAEYYTEGESCIPAPLVPVTGSGPVPAHTLASPAASNSLAISWAFAPNDAPTWV